MIDRLPGPLVPIGRLFPPCYGCWLFFFFLSCSSSRSVLPRGPYGGVQWSFSLTNYMMIFDPLYLRIYGRSLLLAAATTAVCLLIGYPLAYFIARAPLRRQGVWLLLVIIPFWTNFLVRTYAWMFIL